jgi:hypothetical protein
MAHPIFNMLEILGFILEQLQLDGTDLRVLMPVSRQFFHCAIPLVWRSVQNCERLRHLVFTDVILKKRIGTWVNVGDALCHTTGSLLTLP